MKYVQLKLSPEEHKAWKLAAVEAEMPMADWVMETVRQARRLGSEQRVLVRREVGQEASASVAASSSGGSQLPPVAAVQEPPAEPRASRRESPAFEGDDGTNFIGGAPIFEPPPRSFTPPPLPSEVVEEDHECAECGSVNGQTVMNHRVPAAVKCPSCGALNMPLPRRKP